MLTHYSIKNSLGCTPAVPLPWTVVFNPLCLHNTACGLLDFSQVKITIKFMKIKLLCCFKPVHKEEAIVFFGEHWGLEVRFTMTFWVCRTGEVTNWWIVNNQSAVMLPLEWGRWSGGLGSCSAIYVGCNLQGDVVPAFFLSIASQPLSSLGESWWECFDSGTFRSICCK